MSSRQLSKELQEIRRVHGHQYEKKYQPRPSHRRQQGKQVQNQNISEFQELSLNEELFSMMP
jgi:hypothetical protein